MSSWAYNNMEEEEEDDLVAAMKELEAEEDVNNATMNSTAKMSEPVVVGVEEEFKPSLSAAVAVSLRVLAALRPRTACTLSSTYFSSPPPASPSSSSSSSHVTQKKTSS
jgi:hypothetical protein